MQAASFEDAVETVSRRDPRFHRDAYLFLRDALETASQAQRKEGQSEGPSHVSATDLLAAFRALALKEFGPMARTVLEYWGVKDCNDVGLMVFRLVEEGIFAKTDQDSPEEFARGYDFFEAFEAPFLPPLKKLSVRGGRSVERRS